MSRLAVPDLEALEQALAAEIRSLQEADPLAPVYVLVNSTLLRPYLLQRIAGLNGAVSNVRVLRPEEFAARVTAAPPGAPLDPLVERHIVQGVARAAAAYFEPVAATPGFAEALLRLVNELRMALIDAGDLERVSVTLGGRQGKIGELATLYRKVESARSGRSVPEDYFRGAVIPSGRPAAVLVYGGWRMAAAEQDLLDRVAAAGSPVRLLTTAVLDAPDTGDLSVPANTRLISAPDPVREAREAVRACLEWAAEGAAFHEMAIVYRHSGTYRSLLAGEFQRAGIPYYLHDGRPLSEEALGRWLPGLLDFAGSNFVRTRLSAFLAEAPIPESLREEARIDAALWDRLARHAGIVEGLSSWEDRLARLRKDLLRSRSGDEEDSQSPHPERVTAIDDLLAFLRRLADDLRKLPRVTSWSRHLDAIGSLVRVYLEDPDPVLAQLDALRQLDSISAEVSFDSFRESVKGLIARLDAEDVNGKPPAGFGGAAVTVLDVNSLRFLRFPRVAILGLVERSFPSPASQDPLLLDAERAEISRILGRDLPPRAAGPDPEPEQFALACAAAGESLVLSYPRAEAGSSRTRLPSYFYRRAASQLEGKTVQIDRIEALPARIFSRVPAGRLGAAIPEESIDLAEYDYSLLAANRERAGEILAVLQPATNRGREAYRQRRTRTLTAYDGIIGKEAAALLQSRGPLGRIVSPTDLEAYATCPFRYFLSRVLCLEELEDPELVENLSPLDRGTLAHDILERLFGTGIPADAAKARALLAGISDEVLDEYERTGLVGYPMLWQIARTNLVEDLQAWLDLQTKEPNGYQPSRLEWTFGEGAEGGPPLKIGALSFRGRVDRIDTHSDGHIRVVDYKTGRARSKKDNQLSGGQSLQLAIYLLAATSQLGVPVADAVANYAFVSRVGGFQTIRFGGATLESRMRDLEELLSSLARGLEDGVYLQNPGHDAANCRFCDYKLVCDERVGRLVAAKSGDPIAVAFQALAGIE